MDRRHFLGSGALAFGGLLLVPSVVRAAESFAFATTTNLAFELNTEVHIRHGLYNISVKDEVNTGRISYFKSDVFLGESSDIQAEDDQMKVVSFGIQESSATSHYVIVKGTEGVFAVTPNGKYDLTTVPSQTWTSLGKGIHIVLLTNTMRWCNNEHYLVYAIDGNIHATEETMSEDSMRHFTLVPSADSTLVLRIEQ